MNVKREILKKMLMYLLQNFLQGSAIALLAVVATNIIFDTELLSGTSITCIVLVGLGNIVSGFFNFKAYATPFGEIESFISTIAKGDLTRDIDLKKLGPLGRFGPSMNAMRQSLNELVSTVKETSDHVNRSIETVSSQLDRTRDDYNRILLAVSQISSSIEVQSRSATESSKAVEDMAAGVGQISERSTSVGSTSNSAADVAARTRDDIASMNHQMGRVQDAFGQLAETIQEFVQISDEISGSVQVITNIAGQTNMLALNASIEAARAGENGRGFAVVASEVRKLANQSSESASSVQELITKIQSNSREAIEAMALSEREVDSGLQVVRSTEASMLEILNAVETINKQINHISSAAEQFAAGSEQVAATVDEMAQTAEQSNRGVHEVVSLTESVRASMEEITQVTGNLHELGNDLRVLMDRFRVA